MKALRLALLLNFFLATICSQTDVSAQTGWQWAFKSKQATVSSFGLSSPAGGHVALDDSMNVYYAFGQPALDTTVFGHDTLRCYQSHTALVKSTSSGTILWAKTIGADTCEIDPIGVVADHHGNVYLYAYKQGWNFTCDTVSIVSPGPYILIKFNSQGRVLWMRGQGAINEFTGANGGVGVDSAGNVYIGGIFGGGAFEIGPFNILRTGPSPSTDVYFAKYDPNGNIMWLKSIGGTNGSERLAGLCVSGAGNLYLEGQYFSDTLFIGGTTLAGNPDPHDALAPVSGRILQGNYLARFDKNGNLVRAMNLNYHTIPAGMAIDQRENIYLSGSLDTSIVLGSDTLANTSGLFYGFTAMYDSAGHAVWAKSAAGSSCRAFSVTVDRCGRCWSSGTMGYAVGGSSVVFGSHTLTPPGGSLLPLYYVQYDNTGNYLTSMCLPSACQSAMTTDPFENLYVTGMMMHVPMTLGSSTLTPRVPDTWECYAATYHYDTGACAFPAIHTNIKEADPAMPATDIWPNPVSDNLTLVCNGPIDRISVYDMMGRQLTVPVQMEGERSGGRQVWLIGVQTLPAGIYVLKSSTGVAGKFVKQ